jgi:hypothetical protein
MHVYDAEAGAAPFKKNDVSNGIYFVMGMVIICFKILINLYIVFFLEKYRLKHTRNASV